MRHSLATRLIAAYLLTTIGLVAILGDALMTGMANSLIHGQEQVAFRVASSVAALASRHAGQGQHLSLSDPGMLAPASNPTTFLQVERGRHIIQASRNLAGMALPVQPPRLSPVRWGIVPLGQVAAPQVRTPRGPAVVATVSVPGSHGGRVTVAVSINTAARVISAVGAGLLQVGLGLVALATLVTSLVTYGGLRRLRVLRTVVRRINDSRDLAQRVAVPRMWGDETVDLAVGFNRMLDRLQESFRRQELVVAEASHQLRNPLAVALGYSGMLTRWAQSDPSLVSEGVAEIHEQLGKMNSTLDAVLALGSTDNSSGLRAIHVDLAEFLAEWQTRHPNALVQAGVPVAVWVDPALLSEILNVLVDNALHHAISVHAPEISWELSSDSGRVFVSVRDFGPGIAESLLPWVFHPFQRGDESAGAGLGLTLARTIAERHGGQLTAVNAHPGACFTFDVPAADDLAGLSGR